MKPLHDVSGCQPNFTDKESDLLRNDYFNQLVKVPFEIVVAISYRF